MLPALYLSTQSLQPHYHHSSRQRECHSLHSTETKSSHVPKSTKEEDNATFSLHIYFISFIVSSGTTHLRHLLTKFICTFSVITLNPLNKEELLLLLASLITAAQIELEKYESHSCPKHVWPEETWHTICIIPWLIGSFQQPSPIMVD